MEIKENPSMYQQIFLALQQQILQGEIPEGRRIPTEKELMQQYATSRITASRAVRELENMGYVKRIKAKGTFVNSRSQWRTDNEVATASGKPFISIVFPAPVSKVALNMEVFYGVELACRKKGFNLSVTSLDIEALDSSVPLAKEKDLIGEVIDSGALGAIILPYSTQSSPEMYNRMHIHAFPFVLIDRMVFGVESSFVASNNVKGFYSIVEHLIMKGHRNIAFLSGNTYESSSRSDRFSGYLQAMNHYRLPVKDDYIIHNLVPFDYNRVFYDQTIAGNESLRKSTSQTLDRLLNLPVPPTALAMTNDYLALYTMNIAKDMGIRIPEDISITGFDNLPISSLFRPKLTTISQNFSEMGQSAVKLLDRLIKDPQRKPEIVMLETEVIAGDSVKDLR